MGSRAYKHREEIKQRGYLIFTKAATVVRSNDHWKNELYIDTEISIRLRTWKRAV